MLDALAFDAAYRAWSKRLRNVAYRVSNESADAEDIAQDAWIEAWKAKDQIDGPGFWRWLVRVVKRMWWHRLNRVQGRNKAPEMLPIEEAPEGVIDMPQHHEAQKAEIMEAGAELNEARAFAVKAAFAGLDSADVAQVRGVSLQAATEAMRKAVAMLRKKWRLE